MRKKKERKIKIRFTEHSGLFRRNEPVSFGVPFALGCVTDNHFSLSDNHQNPIPFSSKVLSFWPDKSLKWVLFDTQITLQANSSVDVDLLATPGEIADAPNPEIDWDDDLETVRICSEHIVCRIGSNLSIGFESKFESRMVLKDDRGVEWEPVIKKRRLAHDTAHRKTLYLEGVFHHENNHEKLKFKCRLHFFWGKRYVKIEFSVVNISAAVHPQGAWDLGDRNSVLFKSLKFHVTPHQGEFQNPVVWPEYHMSSACLTGKDGICVYQDSSGKPNWNSNNHIDRNDRKTVSFRGYQVLENDVTIGKGYHAHPLAAGETHADAIYLSCEKFWQNFPKEISLCKDVLSLGLFPDKNDGLHELQPGEQKTHTFYLGFEPGGASGKSIDLQWVSDPLVAIVDSRHFYDTQIRPRPVPFESTTLSKEASMYTRIVNSVLDGENTFAGKNDTIDEYGWRNFGDVWADHETVFSESPGTFVSHYNNQYDLIKGMVFQFMRSGDLRWYRLAVEMADHVADIDMYHTTEDKRQLNKGMFWHTDHHLDAATSTHRSISIHHKKEKKAGMFGGGPAPDHNYSSGFLYLYWLTGTERYRETVLMLAENIVNCLSGPDTVCELLLNWVRKYLKEKKSVSTGKSDDHFDDVYRFDGPGRASGNALNTLLDTFLLTGDTGYLDMAEDLISRCVSLEDDFNEMNLLNVELRWMYTIFLQALGRYLDITGKNGFKGRPFFEYARAILIRYAVWMAEKEYVYLEKPHLLEYPNETWAAQEIRKSDVFAVAGTYAPEAYQSLFSDKSETYFNRAMHLLSESRNCCFTRPLAIIMTCGMPYFEQKLSGNDGQFKQRRLMEKEDWEPKEPVSERKKLIGLILKPSLKKEIRWVTLQLKSRLFK